jgi:hypothetical protein
MVDTPIPGTGAISTPQGSETAANVGTTTNQGALTGANTNSNTIATPNTNASKSTVTTTTTTTTTTIATPATTATMATPSAGPSNGNATTGTQKKKINKVHGDNHEVLSDAVAASGVNIRAEEEAMVGGLSISKRQVEQNTFLKPTQLQWFMHRTLDEQGIKPAQLDSEVASTISSSCEHYMAQILADAIVMMRHRRHLSDSQTNTVNVSTNGKTKGKVSKSSKSSKSALSAHSGINSKSEISKALRDLAAKHKEREEKRIRRRVFLGLEEEKPEEDLIQDHKQTNLTASMMMSGSKQKKYSWMQSSSNSNSNSFNSRGDNGIRYREAREEPSVVMRDLIAALENRRIGVSNALLKAYARLKD